MEEITTLVFDVGLGSLKMGTGSACRDGVPSCVLPPIVTLRPDNKAPQVGGTALTTFEEQQQRQQEKSNATTTRTTHTTHTEEPYCVPWCPWEGDVLTSRLFTSKDWDGVEALLFHSFYNMLKIAPEEHPIIISFPSVISSKWYKEKLAQILFETFNHPAIYNYNPALSPLWAVNPTVILPNGLVVMSGYMDTWVVPFLAGLPQLDLAAHASVGGYHVSQQLKALLANQMPADVMLPLPTTARSRELQLLNDIKEQLCYCHPDTSPPLLPYLAPESYAEQGYFGIVPNELLCKIDRIVKLHTGAKEFQISTQQGQQRNIILSTERLLASEILFDPSRYCNTAVPLPESFMGIQHMILDVAKKLGSSDEKDILSNVVVAGGNTAFPMFEERLEKEVKLVAGESRGSALMAHLIHQTPEQRKYATWCGASRISVSDAFMMYWTSKEEYDESGPAIHYHKCF